MRILILCLIGFVPLSFYGQLIHDESYRDESFWKFKSELESCVIQQDTAKLKLLLADRVYESSDECDGPACSKEFFIKYYFSDNAEMAWEEMRKVIRFGFYRKIDETPDFPLPHDPLCFQAPSYFKAINSEEEVIILGEKVNIREQPSLNARVIRQASFEKFACDCGITAFKSSTQQMVDGISWLEIYVDREQVGYVATSFTSYSIIKEMTVAKVGGEWKIISFFTPYGC